MNLLAIVAGWILAKMFARMGEPVPAGPMPGPPMPPGYDDRSHAPSPAPRRTPPRPQQRSRRPTSPVVPVNYTAPWPQVVPSGLPGFPGPGWEPDEPPPPAVTSRAQALLGPLWSGGEGTFKVEKTNGRWIVYRAVAMGSMKGVVAYREAQEGAPMPSDAFGPLIDPSPVIDLDAGTSTAATRPANTALPTLRRGSKGTEVALVQQRLGLVPADGAFGPITDAAVRKFQSASGLKSDGVVGPKTWAALLGRSYA